MRVSRHGRRLLPSGRKSCSTTPQSMTAGLAFIIHAPCTQMGTAPIAEAAIATYQRMPGIHFPEPIEQVWLCHTNQGLWSTCSDGLSSHPWFLYNFGACYYQFMWGTGRKAIPSVACALNHRSMQKGFGLCNAPKTARCPESLAKSKGTLKRNSEDWAASFSSLTTCSSCLDARHPSLPLHHRGRRHGQEIHHLIHLIYPPLLLVMVGMARQ